MQSPFKAFTLPISLWVIRCCATLLNAIYWTQFFHYILFKISPQEWIRFEIPNRTNQSLTRTFATVLEVWYLVRTAWVNFVNTSVISSTFSKPHVGSNTVKPIAITSNGSLANEVPIVERNFFPALETLYLWQSLQNCFMSLTIQGQKQRVLARLSVFLANLWINWSCVISRIRPCRHSGRGNWFIFWPSAWITRLNIPSFSSIRSQSWMSCLNPLVSFIICHLDGFPVSLNEMILDITLSIFCNLGITWFEIDGNVPTACSAAFERPWNSSDHTESIFSLNTVFNISAPNP